MRLRLLMVSVLHTETFPAWGRYVPVLSAPFFDELGGSHVSSLTEKESKGLTAIRKNKVITGTPPATFKIPLRSLKSWVKHFTQNISCLPSHHTTVTLRQKKLNQVLHEPYGITDDLNVFTVIAHMRSECT